jgi:hypothetical protein
MSKRAEEAALKAYPILQHFNLDYDLYEDVNAADRLTYQQGYEKAEKDLGWHSVEECLPEIDEEVIVLVAPPGVYSSPMKICFGHRPNPDGWYAKSTLTGRKKHYTPETYDGWNIPGVKYWMPCPKIPNQYE